MENKGLFAPGWSSVVSDSRNDLVFAEKNKSYGAYVLRRNYNKTVSTALLVSIVVFLLFAGAPIIIKLIGSNEDVVQAGPTEVVVELTEPPPIDETEPPPPPPPPPPPVMETIKFTPPVVVDEELPDEEPPPPQEKLEETQAGTETQEGTGGEEIIIPEEGTGVVETTEEVFTIVEQMPEFPGGIEAMYKFIGKIQQYPSFESEAGISGTVHLRFKVDKEGKISDVEVLRGVKGGPGLDKEAMRIVKAMPPWKPGKQNGRAVSVWFTIPIKFVLK